MIVEDTDYVEIYVWDIKIQINVEIKEWNIPIPFMCREKAQMCY